MSIKPELNEVLKYAKGNIMRFISQYAADLPQEHKEEIEQSVYLRLVQHYPNLDPNAGWKSYVFNHCRGGVLDYVKFGKGFEESKWSIQKEEEQDSKNVSKIRTRVTELTNEEGEGESIDDIISRSGFAEHFQLDDDEININWPLVSHMAAQDECIHIFAKYLVGFSVDNLSEVFGICRARVSQLLKAFVDRFDDPALVEDVWFLQTCYAFGLCKHFNIKEIDQSLIHGFPIGWGSKRVDLYSKDPIRLKDDSQMSLFDVG